MWCGYLLATLNRLKVKPKVSFTRDCFHKKLLLWSDHWRKEGLLNNLRSIHTLRVLILIVNAMAQQNDLLQTVLTGIENQDPQIVGILVAIVVVFVTICEYLFFTFCSDLPLLHLCLSLTMLLPLSTHLRLCWSKRNSCSYYLGIFMKLIILFSRQIKKKITQICSVYEAVTEGNPGDAVSHFTL